MTKIDAVVIKETKYIAAWISALSIIMQIIFLLIGKWDYTVILGNILSATAVLFNFLMMGITIQRALSKDEKEAKTAMKVSQMYRFLFLLIAIVVGVVLPCFNTWTVVIPIFFPRIAISFRPLFDKKQQ